MSRYFVALMLIALKYSVSAQSEGNVTTLPSITGLSESSNLGNTSDITTNGFPVLPILAAIAPPQCPVNETRARTTCGCSCERSCNVAVQGPLECRTYILGRPSCTFMRPGGECCTCEAGYWRNGNNKCVLPADCDKVV